jgi:hypothetical protein
MRFLLLARRFLFNLRLASSFGPASRVEKGQIEPPWFCVTVNKSAGKVLHSCEQKAGLELYSHSICGPLQPPYRLRKLYGLKSADAYPSRRDRTFLGRGEV